MKFLTNLDLNKNRIIGLGLESLGTAPASPVVGQIYYNSSENEKRAYIWNGTEWIGMDSKDATMTGENIIAAINLATGVIDNDNLSPEVNTAIANIHTHTNKSILDATTASFKTAQETKLGHIAVAQAVDLDTMESNIATNNSKVTNATHTGDVTGSTTLTIVNKAVTLAKMNDIPTGSLIYRRTAGTGVPETQTLATLKTDLNLTGTNSGDNAPNTLYSGLVSNATHTGDVTGSTALTITNKAVTLTKMNDLAASTIIGRKAGTTGVPEALTKADVLTLLNVADGAQVNTVTSVAGKTGAVGLTSTDVSLDNVTNDAQVKKRASSINGNIPTWDGTTGDALQLGYGVETTLTGGTANIPRADAVKAYVDNILSANDAMVYKGTIGSTGATVTALPTTHSAGWTYKVVTKGTYAGQVVEVGDMIIAITNKAGTGNSNADWTIVQANIDGVVIGPATATTGNFPLFNGTTGNLIQNSAYSPSSFATANHNHDTVYIKKFSATVGGSTSQLVSHNLNTRDVTVTIRETNSPWAQVITDVEFTTVNAITVKFAVAPTAGQYTVTITG